MKIIVANDIKDILFDKNSVVIPGFGSLTCQYKSASVDGVTGKLTPPSFDIQFDPNQTVDDGILMDFIKSKYNTSTLDAVEAINLFNQNAKEAFEKHEIISIREVGRFYKDFSQGVRFLPEKTNLNIDSYGLPTLQYYPVSRSRGEVESAIEKIIEKPSATPTAAPAVALPKEPILQSIDNIDPPAPVDDRENEERKPFEWRNLIPLAAVGMVGILVAVIYTFSQKTENTEGVGLDKMNVNTPAPKKETPPPAPPVVQTPTPAPQTKPEQQYLDENMVKNNTKNDPNTATDNFLSVDEGKKAVLVIGGFANKNNIKRLKDWISKNNYGIYERESGSMTVIGAEVTYKDEKELRKLLNRFRSRYGDEVEIMR